MELISPELRLPYFYSITTPNDPFSKYINHITSSFCSSSLVETGLISDGWFVKTPKLIYILCSSAIFNNHLLTYAEMLHVIMSFFDLFVQEDEYIMCPALPGKSQTGYVLSDRELHGIE